MKVNRFTNVVQRFTNLDVFRRNFVLLFANRTDGTFIVDITDGASEDPRLPHAIRRPRRNPTQTPAASLRAAEKGPNAGRASPAQQAGPYRRPEPG